MLAFGSWLLVLGKRKYRFRFIWDGRDGILRTAKALIPDSRTIIKWEEISNAIDANQPDENILKVIEDFVRKQFQTQQ
jgi:hypothetical protein